MLTIAELLQLLDTKTNRGKNGYLSSKKFYLWNHMLTMAKSNINSNIVFAFLLYLAGQQLFPVYVQSLHELETVESLECKRAKSGSYKIWTLWNIWVYMYLYLLCHYNRHTCVVQILRFSNIIMIMLNWSRLSGLTASSINIQYCMCSLDVHRQNHSLIRSLKNQAI